MPLLQIYRLGLLRCDIYIVNLIINVLLQHLGSSKFALDGCLIDNELGPSVTNEIDAYNHETSYFAQSSSIKANDKTQQRLFLMSLATG